MVTDLMLFRPDGKMSGENKNGGTKQTTPVARKKIIIIEFFNNESTGNTFSFTEKVLTLADLERTATMKMKESLSYGARESWDYFGYYRKND